MKYIILLLIFVLGSAAQAQTNLRTVMADTNGMVQRPTNFWTANSNSINSVVSNVSGFSPMNFVLKYQLANFANLTTQTSGSATASATNSIATLSVPATNTDAVAAIRLIQDVNARASAGSGTVFGQANHSFWIRMGTAPSFNATTRITLGHSVFVSTNIGSALTNRGFGFEISSTNAQDLRVRLIAHNGTNSTNGPWVAINDIFQRYTIGAAQKTNGEVNLYVGTNYGNAIINTNATISGGPTSSGAIGNHALDFRLESTNTNSYNVGATIYSAVVETSQ